MNGFIKSFDPLLKRLKKYLVEIILLSVALIISVIALAVYVKNSQKTTDQETITTDQLQEKIPEKIFVDVSGAVKKPDLYQMVFGARLKDVINMAGGLSDVADTVFFYRNFNLARIITDQEKIYIPSIIETSNGVFIENSRMLDYVLPNTSGLNTAPTTNTSTNSQLISLNSATLEELDQLPGIGKVIATKIINNRPYATLDELLTKKIVNKSLFEKIKDLITL